MNHSFIVNETADGREGILSFKGNITVMEAQKTHELLLEVVDKVDILFIDLKGIESVDVSFIQLLCATHRECFFSEKSIYLKGNANDPMVKCLERAGYSKQRGCYDAARESCLWATYKICH